MRTVLKADDTVVAENDFYPFGKRTPAGSSYLDFGMRMYSPDCARWLSEFLSEFLSSLNNVDNNSYGSAEELSKYLFDIYNSQAL